VAADWQARFGYPLWLLETFVDPSRFHGTIYRAANWQYGTRSDSPHENRWLRDTGERLWNNSAPRAQAPWTFRES
jgi:hypothetical protein